MNGIGGMGFRGRQFLSSHSRVTDRGLLALADANHGKPTTPDQRLATEVVSGGQSFLALA